MSWRHSVDRCEIEIDLLREEVEQDIWTFRWVWLINLAALVWGVVVRHYDVVIIAALSGIVALVGIGRTRRGRRLVDMVARVCLPRIRRTGSSAED